MLSTGQKMGTMIDQDDQQFAICQDLLLITLQMAKDNLGFECFATIIKLVTFTGADAKLYLCLL